MLQTLRQMASLIRLCIAGPGGRLGLVLYAVVLALELADIVVTLRMITWTKNFYDALQQMNAPEALRQVGIFGLIVFAAVSLYLSATYLRKVLEIRWRGALTAQVLDRWFGDRAYLRTNETADGGRLDNPDQRIAEDCRIFLAGPASDHGNTTGIIPLSLDLVTKTVGLFSYLAVLWSLSTFPLHLGFIGIEAELPRYMVCAAFIHVAISSGVTHLLGRPLKQLYIKQQRREADYRFALVRARENTDAIAQWGGEASERLEIDRRFSGIVTNWKRLIGGELRLSSFTFPYRYTVLRLPTFLALPAFFAGSVTFGGLMQLGNAFAQVAMTLSWFIFAYRPLAELAAATSRLGRFVEGLEARDQPSAIEAVPAAPGTLRVTGLRLETPAGRNLLSLAELTVSKGEVVWLCGASGIGKTTLMKSLAGTWRSGAGQIEFPRDSFLFLPQAAYLPLGGTREAVAYPRPASAISQDRIVEAMRAAGFDEPRLEEDGALSKLSGGERQRLVLARVFLHRPDWVFLDEATSALDQETEAAILRRLRQALPNSAFLVVAHRKPEGLGVTRIIDLDSSERPSASAAA